MVTYRIIKSYSGLVTVSSELTISQVNFDWLFFPKYITWQLPKMCFICHFWQITQSRITLHPTPAFSTVDIHVVIRKPSDNTSFFLPGHLLSTRLLLWPLFWELLHSLHQLIYSGASSFMLCPCALFGGALSKTWWKFKETTSAVAWSLSMYFLCLQRFQDVCILSVCKPSLDLSHSDHRLSSIQKYYFPS